MKKEFHAAVLLGLLTLPQSKQLFQYLDYADRKNLLEAIVHLPYVEKEQTIEIVSQCLELVTGETIPNGLDEALYQTHLRAFADEKPQILARYILSLIRKTDNFYIG